MWFTETGFHIGVDEQSGLVAGTAANVADITQVGKLLHGQESTIGADAGYTGVEKRAEQTDIAMTSHAKTSAYTSNISSSPIYSQIKSRNGSATI